MKRKTGWSVTPLHVIEFEDNSGSELLWHIVEWLCKYKRNEKRWTKRTNANSSN